MTRIVEAKLRPPRAAGKSVRRARVLDPLISGAYPERTVTVVSGPAGAGKTELLAQWWLHLQAAEVPAAWLSLDGYDDDPVNFWSGLLASCAKALAGTPMAARIRELRPPGYPADPAFLAAFYEAIEPARRFWMILDDVHELTSPPLLDGLRRLLRTAPLALKLMLGCRSVPSLALPRMVLEGTAGEIDADALAFDADELRELLAGHGIALRRDELDLLLRRTEGWVAGLELAAASLPDQDDIGKYLDTFAGDDKPVADYLVTEVLSKLSAGAREFLVATAIPERLSVDMAVTLSGRPDAGAVLEQLAHDNALVHKRDARPGEYSYHSLLRGYLLAELDRAGAGARARLHTVAADWYSGQGMFREALGHAAAAGAWPLVLDLLDRYGLELILTGDTGTVRRATAGLPEEFLADPRASLTAAVAALHDGDAESARTHLDRAGRTESEHDGDRIGMLRAIALLHEARLRGEDSVRVRRLVERTRAGNDADLRALAAACRGTMLMVLGDVAAGDEVLTEGLRLARGQRRDLLALECLSYLTVSAAYSGDMETACERIDEAIEFATARGWGTSPAMMRVYLVAAWIAWRRMRTGDASGYLARSMKVDADVEPALALAARILAAYLDFGRTGRRGTLVADLASAWAEIDERLVAPAALSYYCLLDVHTALVADDPGWARTSADRARRFLGADSPDVAVLEAMLDVWHGRGAAARARLEGRIFSGVNTQIAAWLVAAHVADANGEAANAHEAVSRAVEIAAGAADIRSLATASGRVRRLLVQGRGRFAEYDGFVADVLAAGRNGDTAVLPPAEALTRREVEMLRSLPSEVSLDGVARAHGVSVNTVKTHLRALYRKLDVTSRREAVARGRDLGII